MSTSQIIFAVIGFALTITMAVVGYFVRRLDHTLEKHDEQDDARFKEIRELLEVVKTDMVDKRHAFRSEMRDAFANVSERAEKTEERLRGEIARIEGLKR